MAKTFEKLRYHFSLQAAIDDGFAYEPAPIKLSAKKRKELMDASSLETPYSKTRSVLGVIAPYVTKSSMRERFFALALFAASFYLNKYSVDMTADFRDWLSTLTNTATQLFNTVMENRPDIINEIIDKYPLLHETLTNNQQLHDVVMQYPDVTKILHSSKFGELINNNPDFKTLLEKNPTLEALLMEFPGFSEKVTENPELLNQLTSFKEELGEKLRNLPGVTKGLADMLHICGGAFIENTWDVLKTSFNNVAQNFDPSNTVQSLKNVWNQQTENALDKLWNSKDMTTIVLKFMAAAMMSYKATQYLVLRWRGWSTGYYTSKWTGLKVPSKLKSIFNNIDNPGQRIQEDPDKFSAASVALLTGVTTAGMTLAKFSGDLWDLGPVNNVPGGFFWIGTIYTGILLAGTTWVGSKLPEIYRNKQRVEGNLRRTTDNIHTHADQIAQTGSEHIEKELVKKRVQPVTKNSVREIGVQLKMILMDATVGNLSIPLPHLVVAFAAMASGNASMGTVTSLNYAFNRVSTSMSFIVNNFEKISNWIATGVRMYTFDKATDACRYIEEEKLQASKAASSANNKPPSPQNPA